MRRCCRAHAASSALVLGVALVVGGCGSATVATRVTAPTAPPAPTPSPTTAFEIAVTSVPTVPPHPKPTATPTPFRAPRGPYLVLIPSSGPPVSRTVLVRAGHLPPGRPVLLLWSPSHHGSGLSTAASTDRRGNVNTTFRLPAAEPGPYRMSLEIDGVVYATTRYTIRSRATVQAAATPGRSGEQVMVRGAGFLANMRLLLVAYPVGGGSKPIVLGTVHADKHGRLLAGVNSRRLRPGTYLLAAFAASPLAAQMAETYFQVAV